MPAIAIVVAIRMTEATIGLKPFMKKISVFQIIKFNDFYVKSKGRQNYYGSDASFLFFSFVGFAIPLKAR
jgi:hypothetical protein